MRNHTMPEIGIRLHELEERPDAIDAKLLPESMRDVVLQALVGIIMHGDKKENGYAPQMKRSGRVELDHETEPGPTKGSEKQGVKS